MDLGAIRARTSGQGDQVVCPSCGKRSPPGPTCQKCGKLLNNREPHTYRVDQITDDLAHELADKLCNKDVGGTIAVAMRLLKRATVDDDVGRDLRKGLEDVGTTLLHRRLDLEFAVDDAFHLQKKRGPKPERPGDEGKGKK